MIGESRRCTVLTLSATKTLAPAVPHDTRVKLVRAFRSPFGGFPIEREFRIHAYVGRPPALAVPFDLSNSKQNRTEISQHPQGLCRMSGKRFVGSFHELPIQKWANRGQ